MNRFKWSFVSMVILIAGLLGCRVDNTRTTNANSAPVVRYTTPQNGATGYATNKSITVYFSKMMDTATITSATFYLSGPSSSIAGSVIPHNTTAVFKPASDLTSNVTYTATITTGITDAWGGGLTSNYVWSFTTGNTIDITRPTVSSTTPANNSADVAVNTAIMANFSEAMDPATLTASTFLVSGPSGSIAGTVTPNGALATFTPSAPLDYSAIYSVSVTTGAKDLAGNGLAANFTWSFTTGALPDTTPPVVTAVSPATGATGVAVNSMVSVAFNESIDPASIIPSMFVLSGPSGTISGTITPGGNAFSFKPSANLDPSATYSASLSPGATDLASNVTTTGISWSFTTGSATDTTGPTVLDVTPHDPLSAFDGVSLDSAIAACFSEPVDPASITPTSFAISSALGTPYLSSLQFNHNCVTFVPTQDYSSSAYVHVDISTAVTDLAGNQLTPWAYNSAFRPANQYQPHDTTPPTVFSKSPADGATGAAFGNIRFVLDEPVFPPSISASSFSVVGPGGPAPGTFKIYGTTTSFIPSAPLEQNAVYTVTATSGAQDLCRNGLASSSSWTFKTAIVDQSGTPGTDTATGIAVDASGNFYVAGYTDGNMDGNTRVGLTDGFLIKYNSSGVKQWTRQFGTVNAYEWASAVTIDAANNIFVVGTIPAISGITPEQAFVRKYDSGGNVLWENAGVAAASASVTTDGVGLSSVVTDTSGNIYSAGSAWGTVNYFDTAMSATVSVTGPGGQDAVLIKYDSSGVVQWVKMYGSASDENVTGGVKVDSTGAVYVSGWTRGSFGGSAQGGVDTFLFKVDASGNSLWTRQLGSANDDRINDMAIDASDNVYIAGTTGAGGTSGFDGQTGTGYIDGILIKYDATGVKQWTKQYGTALNDNVKGMAMDASGNFYLTGYWDSTVSAYSTPPEDAFVNMYDSNGVYQWTKPIGSQGKDKPEKLVISPAGQIAVCGSTTGGINGNANKGVGSTTDMFLLIM